MAELSYSKRTKKKYCLLLRALVIASIAWEISLNFFPFLEIRVFTHYYLIYEMSENQIDAHL